MPRCTACKPDGSPCERIVGASLRYCYAHDPAHSEQRKRNASRGGKSKANPKLAKLDKQLEDLAADALEGDVERGVAAVVNQIINTRVRLIETERKIREAEELEARLEALEDVLKRRTG
jgi:hypothetical protein